MTLAIPDMQIWLQLWRDSRNIGRTTASSVNDFTISFRSCSACRCVWRIDCRYDILLANAALQSDRTLTNKGRVHKELGRHNELESYLGRYAGLMLYLKEMGEEWYSKVCAVCHDGWYSPCMYYSILNH